MNPCNEFGCVERPLVRDIGQDFLKGRVDVPEETAAEIDVCVQSVAKRLNEALKDETRPIVLCGILKGVYIFMAALSRYLEFPFSVYFLEASSYKSNQTADDVELLSVIVPSKFQGRRVVLIDELFDNGATMGLVYAKLLQLPLDLQKNDILRCTLFGKRKKSAFPVPDIVGIILPDVWLVGYGLDHLGNLRGWPDLWALPKIEGVPSSADDVMFSNDTVLSSNAEKSGRLFICEQLSRMKT